MNVLDYTEFLERKKVVPIISGFDIEADSLNSNLFDFQRVIVKWALKRGRAAIFADTGLGKTLMQKHKPKRNEHLAYVRGYETLAKKFNCGISTARDICTYRTRKNVKCG